MGNGETEMIYLDNAATTKLSEEAFEAMLPFLREDYGNPSAVYSAAGRAKKALSESRRVIAETIDALPEEIYFTSGGSEADNWAVRCVAESLRTKGNHIIVTKVEHHAVLNVCHALERQGFQVTYLDVDEYGAADPDRLKAAIRRDTILISMMYANNEVGTLQPVQEVSEIAADRGILFHTDAVQAYGHVPISVKEMKVGLLSASGHKFHGPKGVGFLYVKKGLRLPPLIYGGTQERGLRGGTENVAGIVGLGVAARRAAARMEQDGRNLWQLSEHMRSRLTEEIPGILLNGHPQKRLPGIVSICIPPLEGEAVLIELDMAGICASSGSACAIGSREPSHVLLAMGRTPEQARGSLRFSLSEETTLEEIDRTVDTLKEIVFRMRRMMGWKA